MNLEMFIPSRANLAGVLAAGLLVGCTGESDPGGAAEDVEFPAEAFATLTSDDGAFALEVRTAPSQPPSRGSIQVELAIRGADGEPRDDLTLHVVPWMTDMAHGASEEPAIEALGGGYYELGPVDMFMSGRWELRTTIAGPTKDSANIVFEIP